MRSIILVTVINGKCLCLPKNLTPFLYLPVCWAEAPKVGGGAGIRNGGGGGYESSEEGTGGRGGCMSRFQDQLAPTPSTERPGRRSSQGSRGPQLPVQEVGHDFSTHLFPAQNTAYTFPFRAFGEAGNGRASVWLFGHWGSDL